MMHSDLKCDIYDVECLDHRIFVLQSRDYRLKELLAYFIFCVFLEKQFLTSYYENIVSLSIAEVIV